MGEIIKELSTIRLSDGGEIDIELNSSTSGKGENIVHIQNNNFRTEYNQKDYIVLAAAFLDAAYQLKKLKNIDE